MTAFYIIAGIASIVGAVLGILQLLKFLSKRKTSASLQHPPHRGMLALPPRNRNFTGRKGLLGRLQQILGETGQASVTQAIAGLGGVGKTQIAIEYAHRNVDRYGLIAWIRAEEAEALLADFADLAHALGVLAVDGMSPEDLIGAVHAALAKRDDWLLVFDNAEGPTTVHPYLPPVGRGHILITSRDQNWRSISEPLDVNPFRREESIEFLINRSGDTDREGAAAVSEAVGDLPLALEQAGAYVETTHGTLNQYAELFAERHEALWRDQSPPDTYHATVTTTWSLAIDRLAKESSASVDLMRFVSFFAADDIPLFLLIEGAEALAEPLKSVAKDEVALGKVVGALRSQSLVTKGADHISVHRLVQMVVRDGMQEKERDKWIERCLNLLSAVHDFHRDAPETWKKCARLLPHVAVAVSYAEKRGLAQEAVRYLLSDAGMCLRTLSNLSLARQYCERALKIAEKVYGPEHPHVARGTSNLGTVLQDLGEYAEAKVCFERALKIAEKVYGPEHPHVATIVNNLGTVLQELGEHAEAKAYCERSLKSAEKVYGPEHPYVATMVNNLGVVLQDLGEHAGAKACLERALKINEKVYGPEHPYVARDVNNLGTVLQALGEHAEAKGCFERALRIAEKAYGPEHSNVATAANNLGGVLQALGKHAEAEACFERALRIAENVYGPEHPRTRIARDRLKGSGS